MAMRKGITDLRDRVTIVTGAGSGIGLQISRRFAEEGISVVASDASEEGLRRADEVEGGFTVKADVSSADDVEGMIGAEAEVSRAKSVPQGTLWVAAWVA